MQVFWAPRKAKREATAAAQAVRITISDSKRHLNHHYLQFKKHSFPGPLTLRQGSYSMISEILASHSIYPKQDNQRNRYISSHRALFNSLKEQFFPVDSYSVSGAQWDSV